MTSADESMPGFAVASAGAAPTAEVGGALTW
jgi:hypothetical protein